MGAAGADRRRRVLDGRLSGELHGADAQGRDEPAGAGRARRAAGRRAPRDGRAAAGDADARPRAQGGRGASLMLNDFLLVLPEEILSLGAMILMLAAAWAGDRAAPVLTWLAVLVIAVAGLFLPGIANAGGSAFGGLFVADNFAAFSKIL